MPIGERIVLELTLVVALVAMVIAWSSASKVKRLTARLERLEAGLPPAALPETASPATVSTDTPPEATPDAPPAPTTDRPFTGWGPPRNAAGDTPAAPRPPGALSRLGGWLRANWIYPVAGAALVMAAIYLVQYAIDHALLSPAARIALAVALGLALIGAAEALRRRWSEDGASLVSATLAGAGVAALLTAVLAAYHLYQMLGDIPALIALALVALLAIGLGWVMGPLLAALGVLAGCAAPFLLGKGGTPTDALYAYFGILALIGTSIGGLRRWAWVSGLAVVAPLAGGALVQAGGASGAGVAALAVAVVAMATALPGGALMPRAAGPMLSQARWGRPLAPEVLCAALALIAALALLLLRVPAPASVLAAGGLAVALPLWTRHAPALSDLSGLAAAGLAGAIALSPVSSPLFRALGLNAAPWLPLAAVALGALAGLAALWRSAGSQGRAADLWALLAVATPCAAMVTAEVIWRPGPLVGPYVWALTAMALAGFYTAVTLWAARVDGGQGLRMGAAAAAAIGAIAFGLMLILSHAALSLALAAVLIAAAGLDRQRNLPELGAMVGLGTMVLGWRMLLDPGLIWLMRDATPAIEVVLMLAATLLGPVGALVLLAGMPAARARDWGRVVAETGLFALTAAATAVILGRFLPDSLGAHALLGMQGAVLIALAWVQLRRNARLASGRVMRGLRRVLAGLFGAGAALCLGAGATLFSPVLGDSWLSSPVRGLPVLNDLLLAYALPAAVLGLAMRGARGRLALLGRFGAGALAALWVATTIRHLWQGGEAMSLGAGIREGELYAYTVALLVAGAGAMALALRLRSTGWRILGLAAIGLAALKAFLIDADGLEGLMRVGAFLGLGLSLAALAWLNGWVTQRTGTGDAMLSPR